MLLSCEKVLCVLATCMNKNATHTVDMFIRLSRHYRIATCKLDNPWSALSLVIGWKLARVVIFHGEACPK